MERNEMIGIIVWNEIGVRAKVHITPYVMRFKGKSWSAITSEDVRR